MTRYMLVHRIEEEGPYGPFYEMSDLLMFAAERDLPADDWYVKLVPSEEVIE